MTIIHNNMNYTQKMAIFLNEVTVYPVSCEQLAKGRSDIEWLSAVLAGGARIVQLRDKCSTDRELLAKAHVFRKMTRDANALFIVNNRLDIAMLAQADGIHIGNDDLPIFEVRKLVSEMIIGISANTEEQAASAQERGASYYNIGPLFSTKTKKGLHKFIGPEAISRYSRHSPLPFTVMGGIKRKHIPQLTALGAKRLAVVTALTKAADIKDETRNWIAEIRQYRQEKSPC